jgi:hypothetical protein
MVAIVWHSWFYKWIYTNDGVGNFTDDIILVVIIGYVFKRLFDMLKKRHAEQRIHEKKIETSNQVLHDHLGTGHSVHHMKQKSEVDTNN